MYQNDQKENYGLLSFLPLTVFLLIYLCSGILFSVLNVAEPFKQIPRETALFTAFIVSLMIGKRKLDDKIDLFAKNAGDSNVILMVLIFILSGAFSGVSKAMGGVETTVNLGLSICPLQFIFAGIFTISALIATAMGTSMGTIAAIGPIAVGIADKAEISSAIAIAAVMGGAMFGDNLSIISDTTIAATRGAGCKMNEKFKMNLIIALPAAIAAIILYSMSNIDASLEGNFNYDIIKVIPYITVLVTAVIGINVIAVLLIGTIISGVIGLLIGTLNIITFAQAITSGMTGMFSIAIVSIMIRGLTGIAKEYGGIDLLINTLNSKIKTRKGGEYGIAAMVSLIDASLANNTIAIIISAPFAKTIAKIHNIAPKRVASLLDIFSCVVQGILPHSGQMLLCCGLSGLSPFDILGANYYQYALGIVALLTIQFGLLRTKEEKAGIPLYQSE